ncbi:hypothetical protein BEP19_12915 [Ammoniphilus oxalaticus]|uniref:DUF218 domain-containing protein n=1 Tax=Ammoniphilus oxalaticus TaxID=66863 RepID=A0A419SH61_9BACL|nr:YdcF family protein [Ammoniphilus oxalaticus]RKD23117.1 hypothetical protein BEP19_12915 [Ammoniphilus oxalaticus]
MQTDKSRLKRYQKTRRRKRKWVRRFLFASIFMSLFLFAGVFLVVNEQPKAADAVIVLSGGSGRIEHGLELMNEGYADHLILSNGLSSDLKKKANNVLSSSSIVIEDQASSTLENAMFTKEIMMKRNWRSAIVVSSDYHMRRVKYLFDRTYRGSDIELTFVASKSRHPHPLKWWTTKASRKATVNEYLKLTGNTFGMHGEKAKAELRKINRLLF